MIRFSCLILILLNTIITESQSLTFTPITPNITVYTTFHDYQGSQFSANGVLYATETGMVMIDTPWDTTQFQPLLDSIQTKWKKPVLAIIATHSHEDRTAGLHFYQQQHIPTYTSLATYLISKENGEPLAQFQFDNDTTFRFGDHEVLCYYPGAGHTSDNIVVYFPDEKTVFGGCFLKAFSADHIGNTADANLGMWPIALKNFKRKSKGYRYFIPGHMDGTSKKAIKKTKQLIRSYKHEKRKE